MTIRVFLVDDHAMFRAGVRAGLGEEVEVVGEAGAVDEAIAGINSTEPDVVLLDVHLPDGGGPAIIAGVLAAAEPSDNEHPSFLALSVSDAPEDVITVIRAGARGYVTKAISAAELTAAIERVAEGDVVFSPLLAGFVIDAFRAAPTAAPADPDLDLLTPRELEVMRLLARGYAYKEIAAELYIATKTVETHASNVLRKLQLSNRHQLTSWAAERRML
jgi:DNA-binding NarL/FixJ family response regulator